MYSIAFCWDLKEKYSFLGNTHSSLWLAWSEFHRGKPSSQDRLSFHKYFNLGSDSRKAVRYIRYTKYICLRQYFQPHGWTCLSLGRSFIVSFILMGHENRKGRTLYDASLWMFVWSRFVLDFIVILVNFFKAKFIWGTSLIFLI